ncbi:GatB/YqeY domain-containing protein [bacterium]|nr:GatB/YqeY domain-containing protein [bacterium]
MFDKVKSDLLASMKEQDKFKLGVLRMLKSALQMEQINIGHDLTDEETLTVIRREVKKRNSSIQEYEKFGKTDTVQDLKQEVEILESYLPAMLSDEEVEKIIDEVIETFENPDIKSMGKIISLVKEKTNGNADMSKVSALVKERLS